MKQIDGVTVYDSVTNFVLIRVPDGPAVVNALKKDDICVRFYKAAALQNCLRITVTTRDVVQRVVEVIRTEVGHA